MGTRDQRVDAYIDKAAEFAQPILRHIRDTVHAASPDIEESIKWGCPHFMYRGIICGMAAFKAHCVLGFWKGSLILGDTGAGDEAMGQFGRIQGVSDLPPRKKLIAWVRQAMHLNETGVKAPRKKAAKPAGTEKLPAAFRRALEAEPKVAEKFRQFSPSQRREYIEWVSEAKREETRDRRIVTAIEWIGEGKPRNWKYIKR
jgi:uncharacterized protein YdeI (YjbR/CyaY-like superfamily)